MDIEEIKKYTQNKIEADDLIKQVRQRIKETTWEKQNLREGFTETFRPLISQFEEPEYIENPEGAEKPKIPKKKNIFTQNQEMLQNQLALTEGLKANQKAITDGLSKVNRLIEAKDKIDQLENFDNMQELPVNALDYDSQQVTPEENIIHQYDIEQNFNEGEIKTLKDDYDYPRPNDFFNFDREVLETIRNDVNSDKTNFGNKKGGLKRTKNRTQDQENELNQYESKHALLSKYLNILDTYLSTLHLQVGQGIIDYFSPKELLHRFELLNGSLAAGNNGVLPEYIQIAHRLRDLGILSNKQLNTLLRKVI